MKTYYDLYYGENSQSIYLVLKSNGRRLGKQTTFVSSRGTLGKTSPPFKSSRGLKPNHMFESAIHIGEL